MDIFCPHCQNHLSIEDDHAGQFLKCPLCSGMFNAPTLPTLTPFTAAPPPAPPVPPAPPAAVEAFRLEPLPQEKSTPVTPPAVAPAPASGNVSAGGNGPAATTMPPLPGAWTAAPESLPEVETPLPVGEYRRAFIVHFNPDYIRWFGPVGLGLVLFLSFFSWAWIDGSGVSLWGLAFTRGGTMGVFLPYLFFLLASLALSIVSMLLTRRIIVLPEPFKKVRPWRALVVAAVALLGLVLLFLHCIYLNTQATVNWSTVAYKLSLRLHELAVVGLLLEFWLDRRHKKNLPLPKIELRW